MAKLPNYLYNQIIKLILDYLLIYNKKRFKESNNHYTIKRFCLYSNELIGYSLISKYWHTTICKQLSNNIIDNEIIEYWFNPKTTIRQMKDKVYGHTIGTRTITATRDKWVIKFTNLIMDINMEFSIIKIDGRILDKYFSSIYLLLSSHRQSYNYSSLLSIDNFKKVENNLSDERDVFNLLLSSNQTPIGHEININEDVLRQKNIREPHKVVVKRVNKLVFSSSYDTFDHSCIANYQPKQFIHKFQNYYPGSDYSHLNYSPIFDPVLNCNIESIKIQEYDSVEPEHLLKINQLRNLHSCSIPISFHGVIENQFENSNGWVGTGCEFYLGSFEGKQCYNDWNSFISLICDNVVLRNLTLKNACSEYIHNHINTTLDKKETQETITHSIDNVSHSIYNLLSSTINNIVYLKFENLDFISKFDKTFSPLVNNKSIKTFVYKRSVSDFNSIQEINELESILNYLISNVFTSPNSSILHFKFQLISKKINDEISCPIVDFIFNLLNENIGQLNLYSIELSVLNNQITDTVFDNIKLFSKLSTTTKLKEINLKIQNISLQDKLQIRKKLESFKIDNTNNNFIINII